jgi:hypothetical protein
VRAHVSQDGLVKAKQCVKQPQFGRWGRINHAPMFPASNY